MSDIDFETANWRLVQWHIDPGHAWIRVPLELLADDNLRQSISGYSYMDSEFAYLEEDCDAYRFAHSWLGATYGALGHSAEEGAEDRAHDFLQRFPKVRGDYADGHIDKGFKNPRYLDAFNYAIAQERIGKSS